MNIIRNELLFVFSYLSLYLFQTKHKSVDQSSGARRGHDRIVAWFKITYAISDYYK